MLIELGVVEQRHQAVLEVLGGLAVSEVARRYGVSRQSVHRRLRRYAAGGIAGLADVSSRPASCPHQVPPWVEERICALRAEHPAWVPRTIAHHLARECVGPGGHFLAHRHTRRHMREAALPAVSHELEADGHYRDPVEVARERGEAILRDYHPEPLPDDQRDELTRILEAADRELRG